MLACIFALLSSTVLAEPIPVQHKEGIAHGFLVLRTREGRTLAAGELIQDVSGDQISSETATISPFEYTALPIALKWKPAANRSGKVVQFEVTIPPSAGLVDAEHTTLDLDVLAIATGAQAEVAGRSSRNFKATLSPASVQQIESNGITYLGDIQVKPGEYAVRLVVRDNLTGRLGSITAHLNVEP
jgi:hypothetical protein